MIVESLVLPKRYLDSVFLMRVAKRISGEPGIAEAAAVMGTERNIQVLSDAGFTGAADLEASADDLVISLKAESPSQAAAVLGSIETWLQRDSTPSATTSVRSLSQALDAQPASNLAVISVPGEYAAREARQALDLGLNVLLFSDNVPLRDEADLKQSAAAQGLIVMGPDCGTAIIGGVGVGFANGVRRGPIGVIGASGTGIQEVTCLVDGLGSGVSHAIGTGSRDLSDAVGGISSLQAIDALEADPETRVIVLLSKPAGPSTLAKVNARLVRCTKPVVACVLGAAAEDQPDIEKVVVVGNMEDAARSAVNLSGSSLTEDDTDLISAAAEERRGLIAGQRFIRGVFAGGTLCLQAQQLMRALGIPVHSNEPLDPAMKLEDSAVSRGHTMIDMGADEFTVGRPHPMIDSTLRAQRLEAEGQDPEVAVVLLDIILGYAASPAPADEMAPAIARAREAAAKQGRRLTVVSSICGAPGDVQDMQSQTEALEKAGAYVFTSAYRAAQFAVSVVQAQAETRK